MRWVTALVVFVGACADTAAFGAAAGDSGSQSTELTLTTAAMPLTDHHVHVFSPAVRHWLETEFNLPRLPPYEADELTAALQRDDVVRAAVLSNAYFFGHDTAKQSRNEELVIAEHDRVADLIARYPDRLVGFFGIDPLAESALVEMERCARRKVFVGVKLHLANAGVDLRNPAHVRRLAEVFQRANALRLLIVIHMRTLRSDYGREDAQIFIDKVLSAAPDVPVQIARLGGWGGYDIATDAALSAFVDAAARINGARSRVYFDLAAVVRDVARGAETVDRLGREGSGHHQSRG